MDIFSRENHVTFPTAQIYMHGSILFPLLYLLLISSINIIYFCLPCPQFDPSRLTNSTKQISANTIATVPVYSTACSYTRNLTD